VFFFKTDLFFSIMLFVLKKNKFFPKLSLWRKDGNHRFMPFMAILGVFQFAQRPEIYYNYIVPMAYIGRKRSGAVNSGVVL